MFCHTFGRLYTWSDASKACSELGEGWRLPTENEWRRLAFVFGGVDDNSADEADEDKVKGYPDRSFRYLTYGGESDFDVLLGGNRDVSGENYMGIGVNGSYWAATPYSKLNGHHWAYVFRSGSQLYGQVRLFNFPYNDKRSLSCRCVRPVATEDFDATLEIESEYLDLSSY